MRLEVISRKEPLQEAKKSEWADAVRDYLATSPNASTADIMSHTDGLGLSRPANHHSRVAGIKKKLAGATATPAAATATTPTATPKKKKEEASVGLSAEDLTTQWLKKHKVNNEMYTINEDGTVDVHGSVYLDDLNDTKLPVKFNKVEGNFVVAGSPLTTLEGCPKIVGGTFNASHCDLVNLKGSPESIHFAYDVSGNDQLNSLEGITPVIHGNLVLKDLTITSLQNIHKYVKEIDGIITLDNTKLTSHLLGLLYIKGLSGIRNTGDNTREAAPAIKIILDYITRINDGKIERVDAIMECAEDLYDAGLGAYAKL